MKTMSVGEFKTCFSEVIERVRSGERIAVTYGRKKEVIGYFLLELPTPKVKRKLGILKGKANVEFKEDFKITEEEFLDL